MSEYEAREALQQVLNRYQAKQPVRRGLLGDSNGTVMVTDRPGWAFIRYRDDLNRLSIVRYLIPEQLPDDCPVKVGKKYVDDPYEQVLGVDWEMYAWSPTESTVEQWATPAITLEHLAPGKVVPTNPVSLSVDVRAFLYIDEDVQVEFGGGAIDLTASVPGVAGHRLTLVYMDLDTNLLTAEDGDIVAVAVDASAPDVPENGIPLAVVDIANGDTEITGDDIYQYKVLYNVCGISLGSLLDYSRGYIIRGGAADWEAHDASGDGYVLVGDGTDIYSEQDPSLSGQWTWNAGPQTMHTGNAAVIGFVVSGAAAQAVDLVQIHDSAANVLAGYDERGIPFADGGTDSRNYFAGNDAGNVTATGYDDIAIGYQAGDALTTAGQCIFIGSGAGGGTQDGDFNVYIGYYSGLNPTSAEYNVGVGTFALRYNDDGDENTAVGDSALEGSGGIGGSDTEYCTGVGSHALTDVQTGADENSAFGAYAGGNITTGARNNFFGYGSGFRQTTIDDALFVDDRIRGAAATELTHALLYGTHAANPEDQQLTVNVSALHMGEDNTPAYGAFLTANDVAGVAVTIIANGTGDVTVGMQVMYFVSESAGGTSGGTVTCLNNANVDIYADGVDTLNLAVAADGSVTLTRTAGAATFDVSLYAVWV